MQFNKKMSKAGAITLPSALRREIGIEAGERFAIQLQENGDVLLKRSQGSCIFCKSEMDLAAHKGRFVCRPCSTEIGGQDV